MSVSVNSKTINQQRSEAWLICKYLAEKSILEQEFSLTVWPNPQSTLDLEYRRGFKILTAGHMGCAIQLYRNQWIGLKFSSSLSPSVCFQRMTNENESIIMISVAFSCLYCLLLERTTEGHEVVTRCFQRRSQDWKSKREAYTFHC